MSPAELIVLLCIALGVQLALDHRRLARACRSATGASASRPDDLPFLSIVRPTKGADVEQLENFRAALALDYPGPLETIFVFEDTDDPAHDLAVRAIEEHRARGGHGDARIVLAGRPPPERTGKINNMIVGTAHAGGDVIAFGDSDTRPPATLFTELVGDLVADPGAGAIFALPVATATPRTGGDVGYAVILNAYLGAQMIHAAGPERTLPFLMGQTMLFRREALDAIGGIECAEGQLVDDMFLGAQVHGAGWRNLLGRSVIPVIGHGLGFADFYRLWRRWLFFGRGGIPFAFMLPLAWRGISVFLALGLLLTTLVQGFVAAALAPAALLLAEGLHYLRLHRLVGGAPIPPRLLWMIWLPQPLAAVIAVSMLLSPEVEWRGHRYRLDLAARLRRPGASPTAPAAQRTSSDTGDGAPGT